jgi:hypothetical protein
MVSWTTSMLRWVKAGLVVDGENVGIGSSAQLNIIGSVANNILIGGFDNDRISGCCRC